MSIYNVGNSRDYLDLLENLGWTLREHTLPGRFVRVAPGTYGESGAVGDAVILTGTARRDVLLAGGGEIAAVFIATRGNDIYGAPHLTGPTFVDYSEAPHGVYVDMSFRGSQSFVGAAGQTRTVEICGKAQDGFGGTDYFTIGHTSMDRGGSSIWEVCGTSFADVMIGEVGYDLFYGAGGDDRLVGGDGDVLYGGNGDDTVIGGDASGGRGDDRMTGSLATGGRGGDRLFGTADSDHLEGNEGNDRILAGAGSDQFISGNAGKDYVNGGAGDDFIDGGIGGDILAGGAGNDVINPDVEYFQYQPTQDRDGARDTIRVTKADLGAWTDTVVFNAFEEHRDEIRFAQAVKGSIAYRVTHEANADDPSRTDTILQIDSDGDGLGGAAAPDADDYFLKVLGADLSLTSGYILT